MDFEQSAKEVAEQLAKLIKKHHLSYDQTKYVIQEARKICKLKPPSNRRKGTVTRLSKSQLKSFLESAYQISAETGLMMDTLYETATRVDEFVNLQPTDLFVSDLVIIIRSGKGAKRREVPITEALARSLQVHLSDRTTGYLFESNRNDRFTTRRIEQICTKLTNLAQLTVQVTPHLLRHTRATQLAEMGMAKDFLQVILGHDSPQSTEIYTHTAARDVKKEFYRINHVPG